MAEGLEFVVSLEDKVSGPAQKAGASLDGLGGQLGGLGSLLEGLVDPAALAAAAMAALTAVAVGVGVALYAGAQQAIEANDELERLQLTMAGLANTDDAGGAALVEDLDKLSQQLPQTRKQLADWSQTLLGAGVKADELDDRLRAVASAQALMGTKGDEAATKVQNLFAKISESEQLGTKLKVNEKTFQGLGVSADDVAKKMGLSGAEMSAQLKSGAVDAKKFGDALQEALIEKGAGPLEAMSGDLDVIKAKFAEAITKQFEDPAIKAAITELGDGMKKFVGLLDHGSTSGQVLHFLITTVFTGLFKMAAKVLPYVYLFLLKLETAALKIYIAFKPVIKHFQKLSGETDSLSTIEGIMDGIVVYLVLMGEELAVVADVILDVVDAINWITDGLGSAYDAVEKFAKDILGYFSSDDGQEMGSNLIDGIISGLTGGQSVVFDKMSDLADGALKSAKKVLGIASPSREMAKLGGFTAEGFAAGIDQGAGAASDAGAGLAFNARSAAASSGGGSTGASGGLTVNFASGAINVAGGAGSALDLTEEALALVIEKLALEQGLVTP